MTNGKTHSLDFKVRVARGAIRKELTLAALSKKGGFHLGQCRASAKKRASAKMARNDYQRDATGASTMAMVTHWLSAAQPF